MTDPLFIVIVGVLAIGAAAAIGQRLNVASPLILVILGLGVGFLPFVPVVEVEPELILVGVLPPLLYSAAVNLPAIEFRRDFGPIAGLSVILVVGSALALGFFFAAVIPELGLFLAIALGAILSPTDAVATSIVKKLGLSQRVVTMLEGESLLNDATALVMLRTALVAVAAGSVSPAGAIGSFVWGVLIAGIVGAIVGLVTIRIRVWVGHSAANTAIGFVVPFAAYLPTEHLGGSGLVAAVVAGIVTGQGAARWFTPEQRLSDTLNWRTVELVLEGAVFLIMGLELREIWGANVAENDGPQRAIGLALVALAIILVARAAYVSLLVALQGRRARGKQRERLASMDERLDALDALDPEDIAASRGRGRRARGGRARPADAARTARRISSMRARVARAMADLDYYQASPLGWKHGTIIVWAGMRGVVTLAAAQTLPRETPSRELLILTAFLVAVISLLVQGFTLPWLVRALRLPPGDGEAVPVEERLRIDAELRAAAATAVADPGFASTGGTPLAPKLVESMTARLTQPADEESTAAFDDALRVRLALIAAMRARLDELSHGGEFSTAALRHALAELDADELSIQVRLGE